MWFHESQRIGKQKCTPIGYAIHVNAELIGFVGLLLLLVALVVLLRKWFADTFHTSLLWLVAMAFGVGIISEVLYQYSWWLALRKGFQFNDELCEATWMEAGQRCTYKWQAEPGAPTGRGGT
jgi:hypothetical protein